MERLTGLNNGRYGIKTAQGYLRAYEIASDEQTAQEIQAVFDRLAAYELTGLDPGQLKAVDQLYLEKCREVTYYKNLCSYISTNDWVPVEEQLPEPNVDVLVSVQSVCRGGGVFLAVDCIMDDGAGLTWGIYYKAMERVLAWRPLPERYRPETGKVMDNSRKGKGND